MALVEMSLFLKSDRFIWKISGWPEIFDSRLFYYKVRSRYHSKTNAEIYLKEFNFCFKFILDS